MDVAVPLPSIATRSKASLPALIDRERRRRRRRHIALAVTIAAIPLAIAGAYLALRPGEVPLARRFRVEPASLGDVVRDVRATGRVEAQASVTVGAEISGRLTEVLVDHNQPVRAGDVMARFDRAVLEAQLAQIDASLEAARAALGQAEIDRDRARAHLERSQRLVSAQVVTGVERDDAGFALRSAEARVRAARAQVEVQRATRSLARANLEHAVIRAPIDGVVIDRRIDPGQTVASVLQAPVLFVVAADLRRMRVIANVDEADIAEIAPGRTAELSVNAYPERIFRGVVTDVHPSPTVVQDVVTYATVVSVDNDDLALKPGMTASVRVRTGALRRVLRVPSLALSFVPPREQAGEAPGVWVLEGQTIRRVVVRTLLGDGTNAAIEATSGLAPGAQVLVDLTPEGRLAYGLVAPR